VEQGLLKFTKVPHAAPKLEHGIWLAEMMLFEDSLSEEVLQYNKSHGLCGLGGG